MSAPTNFSPVAKPGDDSYQVTVTNTGGASSTGAVEVTDELPAGLSLDPVGAFGENPLASVKEGTGRAGFSCALLTCTYTGIVVPSETLSFTFPVDVRAGAKPVETNVVRVSGGGAPSAWMATETTISETPAGFGFAPGGAATALSSDQAGAHPNFTTLIAFDTIDASGSLPQYTKDLTDLLPAGFAGDLVDTPSCTGADFIKEECATGSQVGVTTITLNGTSGRLIKPVYNLTPNSGEVAKIGFLIGSGQSVEAGVSLREPGEHGPAGEPLQPYGLKTTFSNFIQTFAPITSVSLTIWGIPADPSHDPLRWTHVNTEGNVGGHFGNPSEVVPAPYFTNPTSCGAESLQAEVQIDSWEDPGRKLAVQMPVGPFVGCDRLTIEPSLTAEPTSNKAYAPTGLDVNTRVPQTYNNAEGLATSTVKKEVVTLPEGMTVNPSSGAGLQACTEAQYAEEGTQYVEGRGLPERVAVRDRGNRQPVAFRTRQGFAVPRRTGAVRRSSQEPVFLAARVVSDRADPEPWGADQVPGYGRTEPVTGRLVTTFDNLPPLPFSLAAFSFNSGANAPLVTPPACGSYTVQAASDAAVDPAGAPLEPLIPPFAIPAASRAARVPPVVSRRSPRDRRGYAEQQRGCVQPDELHITRNDGEQEITGFSSQLPPA